jgi:hypothetical protein
MTDNIDQTNQSEVSASKDNDNEMKQIYGRFLNLDGSEQMQFHVELVN